MPIFTPWAAALFSGQSDVRIMRPIHLSRALGLRSPPGAPFHIAIQKTLNTFQKLTEKLKRVEAERDDCRKAYLLLNHAHMKLLEDSNRLQVKLGRAAQDSQDSYYATLAKLQEERSRHAAAESEQREAMNDERRVSEDLLETVISEKLEIISHQIEEIHELKALLKLSSSKFDAQE